MKYNVLVLAAHPDDEVLGCGGTIAKLADEDAAVHVAFLADGVSSRSGDTRSHQKELAVRQKAAKKACEILGVQSVFFGKFPDNSMDNFGLLEIIKPIETLIAKYKPDTVFTHHHGDLNIDHRLTHEAVITACRPQPGHCVNTLLSFEVCSSTEWQLPHNARLFAPNWFVDISKTLDRKLTAISAYKDELRDWPHSRSLQAIEHLARWRGATVGVNAAEAFMLGRRLA